MGRPRTFDEDTVLTAAMHAFRREGYARISVTRLEQATGLRTSSLYNAYGDKVGLFERALDQPVTTFIEPRLSAYAGPDATRRDAGGSRGSVPVLAGAASPLGRLNLPLREPGRRSSAYRDRADSSATSPAHGQLPEARASSAVVASSAAPMPCPRAYAAEEPGAHQARALLV